MQAGDQMQQRGLAAAGGADDADKFAGAYLKIDVVEGEQALAALRAVTQANFAEADLRSRDAEVPAAASAAGDGPRLDRSFRRGTPG